MAVRGKQLLPLLPRLPLHHTLRSPACAACQELRQLLRQERLAAAGRPGWKRLKTLVAGREIQQSTDFVQNATVTTVNGYRC